VVTDEMVSRGGWNFMQKEQVMLFKGKQIKLVQRNNFILTGVITDVFEDSILFTTDKRRSLIVFEVITEIISMDGDKE